jgi:hypothetical protein
MPDWEGMGTAGKRKAEIDLQVEILRLEKELDSKRRQLGELRKKIYKS